MKTAELAEQTTREFTKVYQRFDKVYEEFDKVYVRFDLMELRIAEMGNLVLERMDQRFASLYGLLDGYSKRLDSVSQEVTMLGNQTSRHELRLEGVAKHVGYTFES